MKGNARLANHPGPGATGKVASPVEGLVRTSCEPHVNSVATW